jgi:hypothetical protein
MGLINRIQKGVCQIAYDLARLAAFYLISVLIGGFSNILAFGLMQMDGLRHYHGWRWIFVSHS